MYKVTVLPENPRHAPVKGHSTDPICTFLKCKTCSFTFHILGDYNNMDVAEREVFGNKVCTLLNRKHRTCPKTEHPDDVKEEEEEKPTWSPSKVCVKEWSSDKLSEYLESCSADAAPTLAFVIDLEFRNKIGNPYLKCVFRHPVTGLKSEPLWMNGPLLGKIPAYKDKVQDKHIEHEVKSCLNDLIIDVEREEDYDPPSPAKRQKIDNRAGGFLQCRRQGPAYKCAISPNKKRLHPIKAYESILRLMRKGKATLLTKKDMEDIVTTYNLDDWCKPFTVEEASLPLEEVANVLGRRAAKANLFVKPTGLRAWIELAKTRHNAWAHICVYSGDSKAVEEDVYGFAAVWDDLRLSRKVPGEGVLCALLADSKEIQSCFKYKVDGDHILPHDARTVLVLGHVTW